MTQPVAGLPLESTEIPSCGAQPRHSYSVSQGPFMLLKRVVLAQKEKIS